ncbi:hypothetical protein D3C78_936980 [compost metagenome]
MHGNPPGKPGLVDHRGIFVPVRSIADDHAGHGLAEAAFHFRECPDEDIRSFEITEHADVEETGRIIAGGDGFELAFLHAVINHRGVGARLADLGFVSRLLEIADETERIGEMLLKPLQPQEELPLQAVSGIMQAAAMRGIEAGYAIPVRPQE